MWETFLRKWLKVPYTLHTHTFHNPKKPKATILLLHGIGTSWKTWEDVATQLPNGIRVIAVDLLGFGESPKPNWKTYRVKEQADSIVATLLGDRLFSPVIVVGHSLGSLVAVELARRYPLSVKSLVLCSPPFYRPSTEERFYHPERTLRWLYRLIHDNPIYSSKILQQIARRKLWPDPGYAMDEAGAVTFLATLNAAIINQTAMNDAQKLTLPIRIIYGKLDPLIVETNIKALAKRNPHITLTAMPYAGHEIRTEYAKNIAAAVHDALL